MVGPLGWQVHCLRKGIKVHTEIVNQYLKGMDFNDEDVVVWADIMPNRPGGR